MASNVGIIGSIQIMLCFLTFFSIIIIHFNSLSNKRNKICLSFVHQFNTEKYVLKKDDRISQWETYIKL